MRGVCLVFCLEVVLVVVFVLWFLFILCVCWGGGGEMGVTNKFNVMLTQTDILTLSCSVAENC